MKIEYEIQQSKFRNANHKATVNLIYTSSWIQTKYQDFFKQFGMTSQQFNILRILKGQYPKSISGTEIKSRMLDRNSDVSRLLDRLALKKLITKMICPDDKRAVDVSITAQGLEMLDTIDQQTKIMDSYLCLTEEEASQLSNLLDKCRD